MDALALLCNLHADGPKTLQRLRSAGCDSIEVLLELEPADLADPLDQGESGAERLQREARLLGQRLGEIPCREEAHEDSDASGPEDAVEATEFDLVVLPEEEDLLGLEDESSDDDAQGVERVLDTWRELDHEDPPEEPEPYTLPRPVPTPGAERFLGPRLLEGLGEERVERLSELGVRTLQDLLDANALALSRSLPLGYTRVKRLQFLARRACADVAGGMEAARSTLEAYGEAEVATAGAGPRGGPDVAGPFA